MTAAAEYITGALITGLAFNAGLFAWRLVQFFRRRMARSEVNGLRARSVRP